MAFSHLTASFWRIQRMKYRFWRNGRSLDAAQRKLDAAKRHRELAETHNEWGRWHVAMAKYRMVQEDA